MTDHTDKAKNVIASFTEEQASKITGVSLFQLRNWDQQGLIKPSFGEDNRRLAYSRVYSFRDLASLQVLNKLRNEAGCSLKHLREVKQKLTEFGDDVWCTKTLYVHNKKVVFKDEGAKVKREAVSGQIILEIPLRVIQEKLESKISRLNKRKKDEIGHISKARNIVHSKAVVAGTRIPVKSIQAFAKEGFSLNQIMREYPSLSKRDVQAAINYKDSA